MNMNPNFFFLACSVTMQLTMLAGCLFLLRKKHWETWLILIGSLLVFTAIGYIHGHFSWVFIRLEPDIRIYDRLHLSGLTTLAVGLLAHVFRVRTEDRQIVELETQIANQHSRIIK